MTETIRIGQNPMPEAMLLDLRTLREQLLRLHGVLLAAEREVHERQYGRVAPGEMLRLLLNDETFQWLRPLSSLVADIDGALAGHRRGEAPLDAASVGALYERARRLVDPTPDGAERYRNWLQDTPAVLLAHGAVMGVLSRAEAPAAAAPAAATN